MSWLILALQWSFNGAAFRKHSKVGWRKGADCERRLLMIYQRRHVVRSHTIKVSTMELARVSRIRTVGTNKSENLAALAGSPAVF